MVIIKFITALYLKVGNGETERNFRKKEHINIDFCFLIVYIIKNNKINYIKFMSERVELRDNPIGSSVGLDGITAVFHLGDDVSQAEQALRTATVEALQTEKGIEQVLETPEGEGLYLEIGEGWIVPGHVELDKKDDFVFITHYEGS
jgi:hypothetical protein